MWKWGGRHTYIGLEITDTWIQAVELDCTGTVPKLLRSAKLAVPEHTINEGHIVNRRQLVDKLKQLKMESGFKSKRVIFGVPSELVMIRHIPMPIAAPADMKKLVQFEVEHRTRLPFDKPEYDFITYLDKQENLHRPTELQQIMEEQIASTETIIQQSRLDGSANDSKRSWRPSTWRKKPTQPRMGEVLLVAAPSPDLTAYRDIFEECGFKPRRFVMKPLAIQHWLLHNKQLEGDGTFVVVGVHENHVDICLFHNGQIRQTRSMSIDIGYIGQSIQSNVSIPDGQLPPGELNQEVNLLSQYMESERFLQQASNDISLEIERFIDFYRYTMKTRQRPITAIYFYGDSEQFAALVPLLTERLNYEAHPVLTLDQVQSESTSDIGHYGVPVSLAWNGGVR